MQYLARINQIVTLRQQMSREKRQMKKCRYSAETWQNATNEEKKQMFQEYMNEVEKILGVDVEDEVNFFYEENKDGITEMGSYTRSENRININSYVIDKYISSDSYALFKTVTHEMRHAYQYAAVESHTDYQVDSETIKAWENSFDNYISHDDNYDGYKEQEVETDAKWFVDPQ